MMTVEESKSTHTHTFHTYEKKREREDMDGGNLFEKINIVLGCHRRRRMAHKKSLLPFFSPISFFFSISVVVSAFVFLYKIEIITRIRETNIQSRIETTFQDSPSARLAKTS